VRDTAGSEHRIAAKAIVVACGAVETPRLLLLSRNRKAPDGLANESGLVGRNFMETLFWKSSGLHPGPLGSHRGLPSDSICWDFNAPDAIPGTIGGVRFYAAVQETALAGPINSPVRPVTASVKPHNRPLPPL